MPRVSGLQREVLALYRSVIRVAREKEAAGHAGFMESARTAFRQQAESTSARNFRKIEYMVRRGHKQLKLLGDPQVTSVQMYGIVSQENGAA